MQFAAFGVDDIEFVGAQSEGKLDGFGKSRGVFGRDVQAILDHLQERWQPLDCGRFVRSVDFSTQIDAEIALLLKKIKKIGWFRILGHIHPEGDENLLALKLGQDLAEDRA